MDTNITWHTASVSKDERRVKNGHHSFVIYFSRSDLIFHC